MAWKIQTHTESVCCFQAYLLFEWKQKGVISQQISVKNTNLNSGFCQFSSGCELFSVVDIRVLRF